MSLLTNIVNEAHKLNTQRIVLKGGQRPSFFTARGSVEPKKFDVLTPDKMKQLFNSIFIQSGDFLQQRQERKLNILDVGEVICIGLADMGQINVYLPGSESIYSLDHAQYFPNSAPLDDDGEKKPDDEEEMFSEIKDPSQIGGIEGGEISDAMFAISSDSVVARAKETDGSETAEDDLTQRSANMAQDSSLPDSEGTKINKVPLIKVEGAEENQESSPPDSEGTKINKVPLIKVEGAEENQKSPLPDSEGTMMNKVPLIEVESAGAGQAEPSAINAEEILKTDPSGEEEKKEEGSRQANMLVPPDSPPESEVIDSSSLLQGQQTSGDTSFLRKLPDTNVTSIGGNPIDDLLRQMIAQKASDLHITSNQAVVFRIDGRMETGEETNGVTPEKLYEWLSPILPRHGVDEFQRNWDTDFVYEIKEVGRFRINLFRDLHGAGAVIRHISHKVKTCTEIKVPDIVKKFCYLNRGLILLAGPAGSGRSTTLAAIVDLINTTRKCHILTIENPIEFVHTRKRSLIHQREIGNHTNSFHTALKASFREDPDVICIGELSEPETMLMAIKNAEAGRLVFGVMHTRSAISTIDNAVNQFPNHSHQHIRQMLSESLRGIICQTLIRKKGRGRVVAWEILVVNDAVATVILEGRNRLIQSHMLTQRSSGNLTLNDSLIKLVTEGIIDVQHAVAVAVDKKALRSLAHRRGMKLSA